jgi:RNA polymerase sigma factor (sigma-70 family)
MTENAAMSHEADRVADRSIYARLVDTGFRGPDYDRFADKYVRYAYPILRGWIASGRIFHKIARDYVLHQCVQADHHDHHPDVDDLVQDTLMVALERFAEHGRAGKGWSAQGGASLATYFVTSCLMAFPNVYRRWATQERRFQRAKNVTAELPAPAVPDPADLAVHQIDAQDALDVLTESDRRVVLLDMAGYSQVEIGDMLGITARAVEGQLYRLRQRFRAVDHRGHCPGQPLLPPTSGPGTPGRPLPGRPPHDGRPPRARIGGDLPPPPMRARYQSSVRV